jgi:AraC family transcriptional regulator, transcriptional activator of pobA
MAFKKDIPIYNIKAISHLKKDDIFISRFAPYLETRKKLCLPHKHDFYHLLLFTKGSGNHLIDLQKFDVQPNQIYFMSPGQVHSWNFEGEVDGYVINFSIPFFQAFLLNPDYVQQFPCFSGIQTSSVINLPENLQAEVHTLFERIVEESETGNRLSLDMIKVLMVQLFITVGRLTFEGTDLNVKSNNYTTLKKFVILIDKNVSILKFPREYAELLFVTPNYLNAICKEFLGKSAGEMIRDRVVLEAKRLMVNLDISISQIAYQLNFRDNSYFSKFFKKYTGITPEEFRTISLDTYRAHSREELISLS